MNPAPPSGYGSGLFLFIAASVIVIVLAYYASRMLANWQSTQTRGRRLRVLEGVPVGKDRSLLLVAVGKEVILVGASPNGVNLVHQVPEAEAAELLQQPEAERAVIGLGNVEESIRANLDRMRGTLSRSGGKKHG